MKKKPLEKRTPVIIIAPIDPQNDELIHNTQDFQVQRTSRARISTRI